MDMVYAVQVPKEEAEKIRVWLKKNGYYLEGFRPERTEDGQVLFPVKPGFKGEALGLKVVKAKLTKMTMAPKPRLPFDIIGDICIFKEGRRGVRYVDEIRRIRQIYRFVNTFYLKKGGLEGVERVPQLKFLGGIEKEVTLHVENGLKFLVNVKKTYFNPRLATERRRVCELMSEGELMLDMFAGVGPFSITAAKFKGVKSDALDINPVAVELLKKNVELNKVEGLVTPYNCDAASFTTDKRYNRVLMNLPFGSLKYLGKAVSLCGRSAVIHVYLAQSEQKKDYTNEILAAIGTTRSVVRIAKQRVLEYAPRLYIERYDVCLD